MSVPRMLTGDRPTGRLHLGHYVGSLANRVRLQHEYESFFIIADLHMLTTKQPTATTSAGHRQRPRDGARLPRRRHRPRHRDLLPPVGHPRGRTSSTLLLQNLVTVPRLERVPSLKDMARDAGMEEMPYGLLGYPVLQAADILLREGPTSSRSARTTPAHVEITREIARRFNHLYGEVFPVPDVLIGDVPTPGRHRRRGQDEQEPGQRDLPLRRRRRRCAARSAACTPTRSGSAPTSRARSRATPSSSTTTPSTPTAPRSTDLARRYRAGPVGDVEVKEKLVGRAQTVPGADPRAARPIRDGPGPRRPDHRRGHRTDPAGGAAYRWWRYAGRWG